ncbi:YkyA family protein [Bacillus marasmi]|uniref:YkyA family protein n=1 Tax=Bacillus marasmi TaxID=1926279 RepID=UPI0011CA4BD8|nr:YkyA family protein [Bacillus marasmi]
MSRIRKFVFIAFLAIGAMTLSGCLGEKPEEEMFNVLEDVVKAEKGFEDQQKPLVELEKKERELYEKIMSLKSDQQEQIIKLSDEALKIVADRQKHIELEKESIDASKKKFETIAPIVDDLKDKDLQSEAKKLTETMNERYKIHNELYKQYQSGIKYDKELYKMLKDKDVPLEKLEEQVNKINKTYDEVLATNENFNTQTNQYNKIKLSFYKKAGIKVAE